MTYNEIESYALAKKGVEKMYPFDEKTAVFKVGHKMFLLYNETSDEVSLNLKCDPIYALELRTIYTSVIPGYHMSKKHWNTVTCNKEIEDTLIKEWIDDSYDLILNSLTQKLQKEIALKG